MPSPLYPQGTLGFHLNQKCLPQSNLVQEFQLGKSRAVEKRTQLHEMLKKIMLFGFVFISWRRTISKVDGRKGRYSVQSTVKKRLLLSMFQGHYYQWEAFVPENEPCTFWCRAVEDPNVLKQIQQKASDGTQCSSQGLSVCLDGTCQVSPELLI